MFTHKSQTNGAGANEPVSSNNVRTASWCLLALILLLPLRIWAQATGAITGTVADPSGAVIPGARVTASRSDTGVSQSTVTTGAGTYTIPNLVVGTYNVTVEGGGFKTASATGITLDVSQQREINFKLTVVGVESTVEVNATPPLLNTTDGMLGGLVTEEQVQTLPLNGRSIQNLVMMQPGMAQDTGSMGWLAPQWISNGNRGETVVATLDNADATDTEMGTPQFWNFNLDAIAEFKVLQNNYSAVYGSGGGTITQIVSKTGTNQFHGSAFEFLRNSAIDARNFFSTDVPPFQRNEFGATFGGPIRKDRTFFFVEYAGFRQRLGEPTLMTVPTAAERQGLVNVGAFTYQVPLNATAQQVLSKYPLPNQAGDPLTGANNLNVQYKLPSDANQYSIRIDHRISDKDSLFGRASYINNSLNHTDPVAAIEDPSFSSGQFNNPRNFVVSETHIFSPTLLNNFSFTLNRQIEAVLYTNQSATQTTFTDGSLSNWGPDTFITKYVETNFHPQDSVTWTKGRHTLNMGGMFRRGRDNGFGVTNQGPNGVYQFGAGTPLAQTIVSTDGKSSLPAGSGSPNGLISMMEGVTQSYGRSTTIPGFGAPGGTPWWGLRIWHMAGWVQDDMKVTSKLTVNLGLRYEYHSVPTEVGNRFGGVADYGSLYGHFLVNPKPLYAPDYKNFAPRLGVAYKAASKTVLRGGFAIFTNQIPTIYPDQALVNFPMASLSFLQHAPYSITPLQVSLPVLTSTSGSPMPPNGNSKLIPANTPVNLAPIAAVIGNITVDLPSDALRNGYTMSGNATVEQELPGNVNLTVSYVMNNGIHLYQESFPNSYNGAQSQYTPYSNVTPGLGELLMFYNAARSNYNGLQVQVRKTSMEHGISFQANYTWAKNMTDADAVWSAPGSSGGVTLNNPQCTRCEYGPASYSVNNRFVANFEYDIPFGHFSQLPKRLTQGWKALSIFSAQSGFPFTVVGQYGTLQYGYDNFDGVGARPFLVQKPTLYGGGGPQFFSNGVLADSALIASGVTTNGGFNGQYFSIPLANGNTVQALPGNLGRNTFTGPSWWNMDLSLIKDTHVTERISMQFRAEFFNLANHPTFATPNSTLGNPTFGTSTSTAVPERQIQFGLRLVF